MSRGPGKIERAIEAALDGAPDRSFSALELCAYAYPGLKVAEKKHRFAVSRSTRAILRRRHDLGILSTRDRGNPTVVFRKTSLAAVKHAATREKPALGINSADFAPDGPWDRALAVVTAQNSKNAESIAAAIARVRAAMSPAYLIDYTILEALFGAGEFDRLLKKFRSP